MFHRKRLVPLIHDALIACTESESHGFDAEQQKVIKNLIADADGAVFKSIFEFVENVNAIVEDELSDMENEDEH